ncbi:FMN-dependent NADH-azoreductase [Victivallis lenta]|uniref:FMN-dependent NADH-azoreductase n=1 Tax=Victivallis lenta TaxID=2606640 RepID=UPI001DC7E7B1|nr:flavodoxin family protein [Lentisphaeria bacterium]
MKKLLHIAASPRLERSHSRRLANAFIAEFLKRNPDYRLAEIDIGAVAQPRFGEAGAAAKFKAPRELELTPAEAREWRNAQSSFEQLREADRLVVSTPMWNFSMPYHLKQWIDRVMQSGWSFGMEPGKGYVPLLGGKKALFVCSCGGVYDTPEMQKLDHLRPYLRFWAEFNGLDAAVVSLEGTNLDQERLAGNEAAARSALSKLAEKF